MFRNREISFCWVRFAEIFGHRNNIIYYLLFQNKLFIFCPFVHSKFIARPFIRNADRFAYKIHDIGAVYVRSSHSLHAAVQNLSRQCARNTKPQWKQKKNNNWWQEYEKEKQKKRKKNKIKNHNNNIDIEWASATKYSVCNECSHKWVEKKIIMIKIN